MKINCTHFIRFVVNVYYYYYYHITGAVHGGAARRQLLRSVAEDAPPGAGRATAHEDGRQERETLRHGAAVPTHVVPAHTQRALLHAACRDADDAA